MKELTSRERILRMFAHQDADRVPIWDTPWRGTIARWHREGMPEGVDYRDFFGIDKTVKIGVDNSPQYPEQMLQETDEYRIYTTKWGATQKEFNKSDSTPDFLDFTITSPDTWRAAKERMVPTRDRIPWEWLQNNYKNWMEDGAFIYAGLWFGFDVTHSWTVGTERLLIAMIEDPDWCVEMFHHFLDVNLALLDMVWDAGYRFDAVKWPDDMGYKHNQFFSLNTYRELLKPVQKKAVDWAHKKGIKAHLHSCGDINPFIPELIEIGIDAINPLEVKAGMDPFALKNAYGNNLVFHGGINCLLWDDFNAFLDETKKLLPHMMQNGGYIFASDHSVPNSVNLEHFKLLVDTVKQYGIY